MDLVGLLNVEDFSNRLFALLAPSQLASLALVCRAASSWLRSADSCWKGRCIDELCIRPRKKFPGYEAELWSANYRAYRRLHGLYARLAKPLDLCQDVASPQYREHFRVVLELPLCRHYCWSPTSTLSEQEVFSIIYRFNTQLAGLSAEQKLMSSIGRRLPDDDLVEALCLLLASARFKLPYLQDRLAFLCGDQNADVDLDFFRRMPERFILSPSKNGEMWLLLRDNVRCHVTDRASALSAIVEILSKRKHPVPLKDLRGRFVLHTGQSFGALGFGSLLQFLQQRPSVLRVTVPKGRKHNLSTVTLVQRPTSTVAPGDRPVF